MLDGHSGIIPGCPQLLWCTSIFCQASRGCVGWTSQDDPSYYGVPGYSARLVQGVLDGHPGMIPGCPQLLWCTGIICQANRGCVGWISRDDPSYYGVPGYSAKLVQGVLDGHPGIIPG